ncbi:MAG: hypothetical protein EBU90_19455 [Proteobacteria bacterium]|nr:hypothetical protein [Pseudomonadota bacterium]NBP16145.1 hypothetical protein [bacterium]
MKHSLYFLIIIASSLNAGQVGFNKVGYINQEGNANPFTYHSVAIDRYNRIVAVGETVGDVNGNSDGLIIRYNQDGSLDRTFNTVGFINADLPTNSSRYHSVAIDNKNRIVAVGGTDNLEGLIARYLEDGTLDEEFNGTGYINIEGGTNSFKYHSVVIDRNNKIVVVGQTDADGGGDRNGLIARYHENGTLDISFNPQNGFINADQPTNSWRYYSVAIDRNNKIVVAGETDNDNGLVVRYLENGTLDGTFNADSINGGPGYINANLPTNSFAYYSVAIQPVDGKIVVVGMTDNTNDFNNGLIVRYNENGTLDTTFNAPNGFITNIPTDSSSYYSVAIQDNSKIIVVGATDDFNGLIVRYNENGELDTTFNRTGYINTEDGTNSNTYYSVVIDRRDKIVVVGQPDDGDDNGLIARYLSNGVLDAESNWNSQNFRESALLNNLSIGLLSSK